jgi:hypothetical protein
LSFFLLLCSINIMYSRIYRPFLLNVIFFQGFNDKWNKKMKKKKNKFNQSDNVLLYFQFYWAQDFPIFVCFFNHNNSELIMIMHGIFLLPENDGVVCVACISLSWMFSSFQFGFNWFWQAWEEWLGRELHRKSNRIRRAAATRCRQTPARPASKPSKPWYL